MKIIEFLADKLYVVLTACFISLLLVLFLYSLQINASVIIMILTLFWILPISFISVEYTRRHQYYRNLLETMQTLDQKYLIADILSEPHFIDGQLLYSILKESARSMQENVKLYRLAENDYRDYIEMWVHEIKTPLAAAKLIADNNPSVVSDSIIEEIEHVQGFVEQALFYARSANVENDYIIKEIELSTIVHNVIKKHSNDFIYKKIRIELEDLEQNVYTDQKWIEFILDQIVTNALTYTPPQNGLIRIYAKRRENSIQLFISDNGVGIDPKDIRRIFQKGFTGNNRPHNEKATGIGLYLCHTLCRKLYLDIDVESRLSQGTTMIITFPLSNLLLLK